MRSVTAATTKTNQPKNYTNYAKGETATLTLPRAAGEGNPSRKQRNHGKERRRLQ
jgi:hypothetical protein